MNSNYLKHFVLQGESEINTNQNLKKLKKPREIQWNASIY